jgi:hypothetical protein
MHDIDVTALEGAFGSEQQDLGSGSPFSEVEATELATSLLEATSDAEIDHFFGDLVRKAASSAKSFISSPLGQSVMGGLKAVAKKALPALGATLGNMIVPGLGGAIGGRLASAAGSALGMEAETDALDTTKQFVHMAGSAIKKAEQAPPGAPAAVARRLISDAAGQFLPALGRPRGFRARKNLALSGQAAAPFSDAEAQGLAMELLEVGSDAELDQFFGDVFKSAVSGARKFASSQLGQTLTSGLKAVAKQALPQLGAAVGNMIVPGAGGAIGSRLASAAANRMEYESDNEDNFLGNVLSAVGLEAQDSEQDGFLGDILGAVGLEAQGPEERFLGDILGAVGFEREVSPEQLATAKQIVQVAGAAAKKASAAPPDASVLGTVKLALLDAIGKQAPNLLKTKLASPAKARGPGAKSVSRGQWYRQGNKIVLVGI